MSNTSETAFLATDATKLSENDIFYIIDSKFDSTDESITITNQDGQYTFLGWTRMNRVAAVKKRHHSPSVLMMKFADSITDVLYSARADVTVSPNAVIAIDGCPREELFTLLRTVHSRSFN